MVLPRVFVIFQMHSIHSFAKVLVRVLLSSLKSIRYDIMVYTNKLSLRLQINTELDRPNVSIYTDDKHVNKNRYFLTCVSFSLLSMSKIQSSMVGSSSLPKSPCTIR